MEKKKAIKKYWYKGMTPWNKGITMWSKKQKKEMSGDNNNAVIYLKGKTYKEIYGSPEKARKIIEKKKKNYNMMNSATINLKGRTYEQIYGPEKAKKQKEKRRMKTKQHYENGTATFGFPKDGTMKKKRALQKFPLTDSKIELKIQDFLKELKVDFYSHYYVDDIEHAYRCDIFIPSLNMVIECDGNYWHNYPTGKELDNIRTKELIEKGFKVLRLWESEIEIINLETFKKKIHEQ